MSKASYLLGAGLCLLAMACNATGEQRDGVLVSDASVPTVGWSSYAGDAGSQRYSGLSDINTGNVHTLQRAWTWHSGETDTVSAVTGEHVSPGRFEATPLAFGDTLFFSTSFSRVIAVDGRNGRQLWSFDPHMQMQGLIADDRGGFVHRGVASWESAAGRQIFHATRGWLYALDAASGAPIQTFGDAGRVDLTADLRWAVQRNHFGNTSPPAVYKNLVIVGSAIGDRLIFDFDPPGDVQAFDARTGQRVWRWDPVPAAGTPARATWENGSGDKTGHVNVWPPITLDTARGLVFLPVSGASNDFFGGQRLGDNLYAQSLVCLDALTGELKWAQQLVHHGIWDLDPASPPVLTTTMRNGVAVDEVFLAGKSGFLYAFNRSTGTPVWPMPERAVPSSTVPGERTAPTQPHPSWPLPFTPQGFAPDDVVDFTPEIRAQASDLIRNFVTGPLFTPPSVQGTIQRPGWIGGAGWGSTAVDPIRQLVFIKATNSPILAKLQPTGDARGYVSADLVDPMRQLTIEIQGPRRWFWRRHSSIRIPISKPPYGTLTAIDLNTGEHKWTIPLGDTPGIRNHPALKALNLPQLGVQGAPGGVATASGLIFITGGGNVLYAIASDTGRELWSVDLQQVGYSNPMTFRATDGRQYVVVATGDGGRASLQAFVLPDSH